MNPLLVLIPVACIIVAYITSINSAYIRAQLEVNIHLVLFKFVFLNESFATIYALKPLVSVVCVHRYHVII